VKDEPYEGPDRRSDRLETYEAWFPFLTRLGSFITGLGIMFWQTVLENADRPYLIGAALALMGFPVAGVVGERLGGRK
jgi:hypothetical protein